LGIPAPRYFEGFSKFCGHFGQLPLIHLMSVSILVRRFVRCMIPPRRVEIFNPDIPRMMIQVSVVIYPIPTIGRYWIPVGNITSILKSFSEIVHGYRSGVDNLKYISIAVVVQSLGVVKATVMSEYTLS